MLSNCTFNYKWTQLAKTTLKQPKRNLKILTKNKKRNTKQKIITRELGSRVI